MTSKIFHQKREAPFEREQVDAFLAGVMAGKAERDSVRFNVLCRDGKTKEVEVTTALIQYNGRPAGMGIVRDITQRTELEAAIRESEQKHRSLIENLNIGVYRNTLDGRWLYANLFHSRLFGYDSTEELMAVPIIEQYVHPEDRAGFVGEIKKSGFVFNKELQFKKKDGTPFWAAITARAHYNERGEIDWIDGVFVDVTKKKEAEMGLWESEERYRLLAQSIQNMIVKWDEHGVIKFINPFACKIFGYEEEELVGKRIQDTIVPEKDSTGRNLHEVLEGILNEPEGHAYYENENRKKDGTILWVSWTNKIIITKTGRKEVISAGTDITERRLMEERMRKINAEMKEKEKALRNILVDLYGSNKSLKQTQQALLQRQKEIEDQRKKEKELREQAEAATKTKGEFLANMSHEIRTPLNSVLGFIALLRKTDLVGDQKRFAENIYTSSQHLLFLVNDILDYEKAMAGKVVLEKQDFRLREFIKEVIELGETWKEQNQVSWHVEENVPDGLKGDSFRLRQILVNLFNNAYKFTRAGSVHLQVAVDEYPQPIEDGLCRLRFMVADTGIGISPEKQKNIFEAFMQADSSTTRQYGGAGLGLAISRAYVKLMGGNIWVSSEPGKGSKFYFTAVFERGA